MTAPELPTRCDAQALRAHLARLRREGVALRRRPAREVVEGLASVLERWRDPGSPERRVLEAEGPARAGFAAATFREGLSRGLAPWTGDALRELVAREVASGAALARGYDTSAVLLAGAIPMPTLLGLLAPLALGSPVLAKSAPRDPLTAPLVARSIAAIDPGLGRCIEVVAFPSADAACLEAFLSAECVVATGSDATIASVARRLEPGVRLLRHGHRFSLAALGPEACEGPVLERAARGLALDTALWDQLGCLSPVAVYVVGDTDTCHRVGAALAAALAELGRELPRGEVSAEAAALAAHERSGAELRAAAGRPVAVHTAPDSSWCVVCEADADPRPAPLHRFLRVHPLATAEALLEAVAPLAKNLAGVARCGFGAAQGRLDASLGELGASRVCEPGELQAPPLGWPRDGLPVLGSLIRAR